MNEPTWLDWAKRLLAIAQTGLTYAQSEYDVDRYTAVRQIACEMMAPYAGSKAAPELAAFFGRETGYATPKVDVRAAVFRDGQVLLVREREDGAWTLPGGWADVGEAPGVAVVREVKEESGYDVVARKVAAVYDRDLHDHPPIPYHAYKLFFLCDLVGGAPVESSETDGVGFFPVQELPPLSLTRVTAKKISHLFDHHRHPEWPTSFD